MNTQFITKQIKTAVYWKLAIFKSVNGVVIVILGSLIAALANQNWSEMDAQSKFLLIAGVSLSALKSLDMMLDSTISNLKTRKPDDDQPKQP